MAYDILRGKVTVRNWSRGGEQNIGTVGAVGGEGMKKKLIVGAALGAAATIGFLAWRHHEQRFARGYRRSTHPMARTMVMERRPGGRYIRTV